MVNAPVAGPEAPSPDLKPTLTSAVRVIVALGRPHTYVYAVVFLLSVLEGILGGLAIAALFPFLKSVAGIGVSEDGGVLKWIQGVALLLPIRSPIVSAGCLLLVLAFLKCVIGLSRDALTGYAGAQVGYRLRSLLLRKYISGGYSFFLDHRQEELIYNLYVGCLHVGSLFNQLPILFAQVVNILSLLALLFSIHAKATVVLIVFAGTLHVGASWISRRVIFPIGKSKKECMVVQQGMINEFIAGFKQIFVAGTVEAWAETLDRVNRRFRDLFTKETGLLASPKSTWEFVAFAVGATTIMWIGTKNPEGFAGQVAAFGVYLVALQRMLPFMSTLSRHWMSVYGALPDAYTVYHALHVSFPPGRRSATRPAPVLSQCLWFDQVSFQYRDRDLVLRDINATFEKGKVTAIVGASGAGKTTIVNLILGLFKPTSGSIRIDGVDLKDVQLDSWLAQIGLVSQDTFIFNGTIRDNIAFFRRCSWEEIEEAARLANAHDFIIEFPDGYDTVVGDRGMKISGGQQQRVALARAILKKPDIFILDEATSSLDSLSETLIRDSLRKIAMNRTLIVVAHRLSTIIDADKILVLKDGSVAEEGTHAELLDARQHYCRLYQGNLPQTSS